MLRTDRLEEISFTVEAAADEQFIVQRLEREKRCGTVRQLDAEHYCFSAAVYDARGFCRGYAPLSGALLPLDAVTRK